MFLGTVTSEYFSEVGAHRYNQHKTKTNLKVTKC